ncbi:hypothetical protein [Nocardiopsis flavescens]
MNHGPLSRPVRGGALTRAGAGVASVTLAVALTSCSFALGDLEPVGGGEAAPTGAATPPGTEAVAPEDTAGETADAADADAPDTEGGLPVDPAGAVPWDTDTYWLSGTGDALYRLDWTASAATTLQLTHGGDGNFIVVPYTADGNRVGSVVNEIGVYEGASPFSEAVIGAAPEEVEFLHIQANGAWTLGR